MIRPLAAALLLLQPLAAAAEEGMWTYNNFPKDAVKKAYGFQVTDAWLGSLQRASARLAQGCSASFVSRDGLVMTNHHCAHSCIEQLSTGARDYVASGFYAKTAADEVKCPELEVNQLLAITDVTARVLRATEGRSGKAFFDAQRAEQAAIEKECQTGEDLLCEVVSLHRGGHYDLYRYRRFQDVRLAFAPEFAIAFFGGDPDNFMFPRWDLDVAFLRVYQGGKPARMDDWLRWSAAGAADGELTFVSGHPGRTNRQLTVDQLVYQRDTVMPERLLGLAELRGLLTEYQRRGPEQARHAKARLFYVENSFKAIGGYLEALKDPAFFESKVRAEADFKNRLLKDRALATATLPAFAEIAEATAEQKRQRRQLEFKEKLGGGELISLARHLVRAAAERPKPNGERLKEYGDAALPALAQEVLSEAPIHPEFEVLLLGHALSKLREKLGPDDPFTKRVLGVRSPDEVAEELVKGTRLADPAERRRLWEGGQAAVDEAAKTDAMLAFIQRIDPEARAVRQRSEDTVQAALLKGQRAIARARFALEGTSAYPDATFTLRLSYGAVRGYLEDGKAVAPFTTLGGAYQRHTGRDPFALPKSWLDAESKVDKAVPFNFVTTNDIIGGNSGSPVVNAKGEVVGLVFDGNIQSLGGDYWYDAEVNRTVSVHSSALLEALSKIYGADRIVKELRPGKK